MKNYMLLFISLAVLFCSLPFAVSLMPQDSRQGAPDTSESSTHSTGEKYISVKKDGILCRMTLEDWTLYALCHELPDDAPPELAKTLAVALRTYAAYHIGYGDKKADHPDCELCSDANHCKSLDSENISATARAAVNATHGELIYYDRQPINPIMHTSSAVLTESVYEVLGVDVPYLQSVDTPDESGLDGFSAAVEFSKDRLAELLGAKGYSVSGDCNTWITYVSYTPSGRVRSVSLCGQDIDGQELAKMLGLQSLNFTVKATSGKIIFETQGIGSGVGMSKYGAYLMALRGDGYEKILMHYYSNTYIGAE